MLENSPSRIVPFSETVEPPNSEWLSVTTRCERIVTRWRGVSGKSRIAPPAVDVQSRRERMIPQNEAPMGRLEPRGGRPLALAARAGGHVHVTAPATPAEGREGAAADLDGATRSVARGIAWTARRPCPGGPSRKGGYKRGHKTNTLVGGRPPGGDAARETLPPNRKMFPPRRPALPTYGLYLCWLFDPRSEM